MRDGLVLLCLALSLSVWTAGALRRKDYRHAGPLALVGAVSSALYAVVGATSPKPLSSIGTSGYDVFALGLAVSGLFAWAITALVAPRAWLRVVLVLLGAMNVWLAVLVLTAG